MGVVPTSCDGCPTTWAEVDRLEVHSVGRINYAIHAPWLIVDGEVPEIHVYAPASEGADAYGAVTVTGRQSTAEQESRGYRIRLGDRWMDIGMDGVPDVYFHVEDWNSGRFRLGSGDDLVDLRSMPRATTNAAGAGNEHGSAGCDCGGGSDRYFGNSSDTGATLYMGAGDDFVILPGGVQNYVEGGPGRDRLIGGRGVDKFYGGPGRDVLIGRGGNDVLHLGNGGGIANGGAGDDWLTGGIGGVDTLVAGPGGALMWGQGGFDKYIGGSGRDSIVDPFGITWANLGGGNDYVKLDPRKRHRVNCGSGRRDDSHRSYAGVRNCNKLDRYK